MLRTRVFQPLSQNRRALSTLHGLGVGGLPKGSVSFVSSEHGVATSPFISERIHFLHPLHCKLTNFVICLAKRAKPLQAQEFDHSPSCRSCSSEERKKSTTANHGKFMWTWLLTFSSHRGNHRNTTNLKRTMSGAKRLGQACLRRPRPLAALRLVDDRQRLIISCPRHHHVRVRDTMPSKP